MPIRSVPLVLLPQRRANSPCAALLATAAGARKPGKEPGKVSKQAPVDGPKWSRSGAEVEKGGFGGVFALKRANKGAIPGCSPPLRQTGAARRSTGWRTHQHRYEAVRHSRLRVGADMHLHPEAPRVPLLRLPHLRIPLARSVLRRRRCRQDARVRHPPRGACPPSLDRSRCGPAARNVPAASTTAHTTDDRGLPVDSAGGSPAPVSPRESAFACARGTSCDVPSSSSRTPTPPTSSDPAPSSFHSRTLGYPIAAVSLVSCSDLSWILENRDQSRGPTGSDSSARAPKVHSWRRNPKASPSCLCRWPRSASATNPRLASCLPRACLVGQVRRLERGGHRQRMAPGAKRRQRFHMPAVVLVAVYRALRSEQMERRQAQVVDGFGRCRAAAQRVYVGACQLRLSTESAIGSQSRRAQPISKRCRKLCASNAVRKRPSNWPCRASSLQRRSRRGCRARRRYLRRRPRQTGAEPPPRLGTPPPQPASPGASPRKPPCARRSHGGRRTPVKDIRTGRAGCSFPQAAWRAAGRSAIADPQRTGSAPRTPPWRSRPATGSRTSSRSSMSSSCCCA